MLVRIFAVLNLLIFTVSGFSVDRRSLLKKSLVGITAGIFVAPKPGHGVITNKVCTAGVGDGCDDLAEGNEFVKELQRRSAENREANIKDATLAYQMKNYPDFFASLNPPKYMVMKPDRSGFLIFTEEELAPLKQAGKIKIEKATAFGGKTQDMTQKAMLVLVE